MRKYPSVLFLAAVIVLPGLRVRACDELGDMRRALADAQAHAAAYSQQAYDSSLAEANLIKDIMNEYLSLDYFPGLFSMRDDAFTLKAQDSAAYRAVSARLAFLRGTPGSSITLKPGAERTAQFAALKADYDAVLQRAGAQMRALGDTPARRQPLWGLAEWAAESSVKDGGKDYDQVMTRETRDPILAAAASDPHE